MKRINNAVELAAQSWAALRANPQLLVFPLISAIGAAIVTILFFIPIAGAGFLDSLASSGRSGEVTSEQGILTFIVLFLFYIVMNIVVIFSNTALVGAALKIARGETATVSDGISIAMSRIGSIVIYAIIGATVGMLARTIAQSGRESKNVVVMIIAAIIGGLLQGAWSILVFFAIPVMVVEDIGPVSALKRSLSLFRQTWGESFVGSTAIAGISCLVNALVMIVGFALIFLAIMSNSVALIIGSIVLLVLAFVVIGLLNGAINGIFQASLYLYATTGDAGRYIDSRLAGTAFVQA